MPPKKSARKSNDDEDPSLEAPKPKATASAKPKTTASAKPKATASAKSKTAVKPKATAAASEPIAIDEDTPMPKAKAKPKAEAKPKATASANPETTASGKPKVTTNPKATSKANAVNSIEPKKAKKIPIRKVLKDLVWSKWIGDDIARHSCLCCGVNEIKMNQFHCGHIIAESNGGITSIENLKPICAHCNLSMSTDNFDDFRKRCGFDVPVKPTAKPKTQAVRKTKITELLINGSLSLCPGTEERYTNIGSIFKSSPCNDSYFTNFTKHCDRCNNHYHVGIDTSKLCPCFSIR